VAQTAKTTKK
jgi:hypothetical protein